VPRTRSVRLQQRSARSLAAKFKLTQSAKVAARNNGDYVLDCLIIGGGPAGLTAAIYLARYRRSVAVYSEGKSRASCIPTSHNYPGFPSGISGTILNLEPSTEQLRLNECRPSRQGPLLVVERRRDLAKASVCF
jgi:hypothetical protein